MRFEQITAVVARVIVDQIDRVIAAAGAIAHVLTLRLRHRHLGQIWFQGRLQGSYSGHPNMPGGSKRAMGSALMSSGTCWSPWSGSATLCGSTSGCC